jgi:hypothetical protein
VGERDSRRGPGARPPRPDRAGLGGRRQAGP